ncbi:restriction endonuclease subunit S [Paucilactobacillus hokkaidonensis]|nr:restriction endonuclease subunit S [Paucilactobacillus hokkaidonensis]
MKSVVKFGYVWEQRKLGELGSTYSGLSGKSKNDFGHGHAKFITYMNVYSNPISSKEMVENVELDAKQNQVEKGDVFFTTSSETPDEVGMSSVWTYSEDNIYLNSFCFAWRPTKYLFDNNFLAYTLRSPFLRRSLNLLAQGISRYNISKQKLMKENIFVPILDEQIKIGNFMKYFDDLIAANQCQQKLIKNGAFINSINRVKFTNST